LKSNSQKAISATIWQYQEDLAFKKRIRRFLLERHFTTDPASQAT